MQGKRVLVTGGGGSIGSEIVRQLAPNNKVFIVDINETAAYDLREELRQKGHWVHSRTGDIRNTETVFDVFSDFKPEVVIHCAAVKHVTPNNEYPEEAFSTNIQGTYNLVREAKRWECLEKFVFISTDKVVNAKCIMGITKLCAESFVRLQGQRFVAVRFGNVMKSRGSVLEIWERQIEKGEPLTITDWNCERYMMSIPEACSLVLEAGERGDNGELWIMDMGDRKTLKQLYDDFLTGKDFNPEVKLIGLRPGEALKEELMTEEEWRNSIKKDNFYILQ